jgi:predicted O-methyltransferase YrrM
MLELYTWGRGWPFAHILELGTRTGNSTAAFLAALDIDRRGHLWSIDADRPQVPAYWHDNPYWSFLQADDLSDEAQAWAPKHVEVLFIDTSHTYEHTLAELRMWVPRVRPGGVVLMHDTEFAPPAVWGIDPHESAVGRALDDYCAERRKAGDDLEWRNRPGCYGLGVMRPR